MIFQYIFTYFKQLIIFSQIGILYFLYKFNYISFNYFVKNTCIKLTNLSHYYIKIFQWQIQDKYLNNEELDDFFKTFTNNVPYSSKQIDYTLLNNIMLVAQQNNDKLTILNQLQPINSGTIALVWKGILNEQPVAIKIIRNNIENEIKQCVNITCFLVYLINFFTFNLFNDSSTNVIKENLDKLLEQCNFHNEVENINIFYNYYKHSDNIIIPKVYHYFTQFNNKVIVMDFIQGLNATQLTNQDKNKFAPIYNFFYNDSIFVKNICHSDLHIGNIVFIKTSEEKYKIGIYDFGLIHKLTKQDSKKLFKFLTMLTNNNRKGVIETLVEFSIIYDNSDKKILLVNSLLNKHIFLENKSADFQEINIIFQEAYKHNLTINKNTSAILLSFISSLYLSKIFADNKSITKTFKNFLYNDTIACN